MAVIEKLGGCCHGGCACCRFLMGENADDENSGTSLERKQKAESKP